MDKKKCDIILSPTSSKDHSRKEKKYVFYRKPSLKMKGPEVKQTKTSMKRLMIANPLLKLEKESVELKSEKVITEGVGDIAVEKLMQTSVSDKDTKFKKPSVIGCNIKKGRINSIIAGNSSDNNTKSSSSRKSTSKQSVTDFNTFTKKILSSTPCEIKLPVVQTNRANKLEQGQKRDEKNKENIMIRRSISEQHLRKGNVLPKREPSKSISKARLTRSSDNLHNLKAVVKEMPYHEISPIAEGSLESSFDFKTPSASERRSRISTPLSAAANRRSLYRPTTPLPSLQDLQKRLNDWLVKRGKSLSSFYNLKCFEKPVSLDEENKENVDCIDDYDRSSYEDLFIPQTFAGSIKTDDNQRLTAENIDIVSKAALLDLQKLLQEGFPVRQCEGWLCLIKEKYSKLSEEPVYWECRATIEESRGDISNAVECYRTAIVQGAEVHEVDKALDVLLKKFSILDINSEYMDAEKMTKERVRIIREARNVFKSSIIKFAVQEKKLKTNSETKLVAIPVRRSTRLSRSAYISTPGVKLCSSLRELESPDRSKVLFQNNKALD